MQHPRRTGLSLLLVGALVFLGSANNVIPASGFWLGVLMYPIGGLLFLKGNRHASQEAEQRAQRAVAGRVSNRAGDAFAARQEAPVQRAAVRPATPPRARVDSAPPQIARDEIVFEEGEDDDFSVTTDVSFPVEVQSEGALGDQLEKLRRLAEDGLISAEEFAAAKTKLLS